MDGSFNPSDACLHAAQRHEVIMPLKSLGVIEIPDAAGSAFDHGMFDPKTRRVFIAHTARSTHRGDRSRCGQTRRDAAGISGCRRRRRRRR